MKFDKLLSLIQEAIPLKNVKKKLLCRQYSPSYKKPKLNELFNNKDRLVYPLELKDSLILSNDNNPLIDKITDVLYKELDVTIRTKRDYIKGVAFKINDNQRKQPFKIVEQNYKFISNRK